MRRESADPKPLGSFVLEDTTVDELRRAMLEGRLTATELVEGYLERIDAYDKRGPELNAVLAVNPAARDLAQRRDEHLARTGTLVGPLHGVPVLVKDCIETEGIPTTFGSVAVGRYTPEHDATVVRKLYEAGAVVLAKTTLADFAASWFSYSSVSGETRNAYRLDRDSGGSSAGTGAGVAANFATVGIGTDCGGSIRIPAAFNNLVGVRTTPGLVSRTGSSPLITPQDTVGPLTRTVTDAAIVLDALVGYDPADPFTVTSALAGPRRSYREGLSSDGLRGARIGLIVNALGSDDSSEAASVNEVVAAAVEHLRLAGATVLEVSVPDLADHIAATSMYVARVAHDLDAFLAERPMLPCRTLREIQRSGRYDRRLDLIDAVADGPTDPESDFDYLRRFAARDAFTRLILNILVADSLDALAYPTAQVLPPRRDENPWTTFDFPTNTVIASQAWLPAIAVPAGFAHGVPVGLDLLAKPYDEATLFRLAYAYEQATLHRTPPQLGSESR